MNIDRKIAVVSRFISGAAALILLVVTYFNTMDNIRYAERVDASAIQVIQVYVEGIFTGFFIIAVLLAIYIFSRFYEQNNW